MNPRTIFNQEHVLQQGQDKHLQKKLPALLFTRALKTHSQIYYFL